MSGVTDSHSGKQTGAESLSAQDKGKGRVVDQSAEDVSMLDDDVDDSSDEEAEEDEEEEFPNTEDVEEDSLEEIDTSNIIHGGRTRGKNIDFTKLAAQEKEDPEYDEGADADFKAPKDEDAEMKD